MWKAYASRVSSVRVFVTDKDEEAVKLLQSKVKGTRLEAAGALKATRPDFQQIINDMMMDTVHRSILNGTAGSVVAPTLVTFCGGSLVSSLLNKACLRTMCGAKALKGVKHHRFGCGVARVESNRSNRSIHWSPYDRVRVVNADP